MTEALERLRQDLAENRGKVASAAVYGSYARGTYDPAISDINVAIVVRDEDLAPLVAPLQAAWRAARIDPWIVRDHELAGLADAFATRVRDIQRAHEMLVGDDPWAALVVPPAALRLRVEQELRNHQIRLRHAIVLADVAGKSRQLHATAGALRLDLSLTCELAGRAVPGDEDGLARTVAALLDMAQDDVAAVLAYRAQPRGPIDRPLAAAGRLLELAVAFVDRMEVT